MSDTKAHKDHKRAFLLISIVTLLLLSTCSEVVPTVQAVASDYVTVPGVLNSDYYSAYPYDTTKNLTIGISKYGELIDPNTRIGLQYGTPTSFIDPFASDPFVPEFEWNQGWVINITYSYESQYRNVWAFALYSDSYSDPGSIGKDWQRATSADSTTVLGGRKYGGYSYGGATIGYASTEPFTVLYNGPRRFVGLSNTTIGEDANTPLVRVYLTFIFDKVNKYVVVLKDIKLVDTRKGTGKLQVEFSNRGEWDLGKTTAPVSLALFFDDLSTCYHGWHPFYGDGHPALYDVAQVISTQPTGYVGFAAFWPSLISKYVEAFAATTRKQRLTTMETWKAVFTAHASQTVFTLTPPTNPAPIPYPRGSGIWSDDPMVFVNGELRPEGSAANGYLWSGNNTVTFNIGLADGDKVWIVYKREVHQTEMSASGVPYVIGEWDFDLKHSDDPTTTQFRGVTVYGIVDNHDAGTRNIDREAQYQLDTVFNPWDLRSAVEKQDLSWVFKKTITTSTSTISLTQGLDKFSFVTSSGDGRAEWSYGKAHSKYWSANLSLPAGWDSDDGAAVSVPFGGKLCDIGSLSFWYYKPAVTGAPYPYLVLSLDTDGDGTTDNWLVNAYSTPKVDVAWTQATPSGTPNRWMGQWNLVKDIGGLSTGYEEWAYWKNSTLATTTVLKVAVDYGFGSGTGLAANYVLVDDITVNGYVLSLEDGKLVPSDWDAYLDPNGEYSVAERVFVDGTLIARAGYHLWDPVPGVSTRYYNIDFVSGQITFSWNLAAGSTVKVLYSTMKYDEIGRYEWGIVGRDAATVDSAGLSMISAAFKEKRVEYGLAGEDMFDPAVANQIPSVMSKFGTGNTKADYKDALLRAALKDDWCKTWPITKSNIAGSGGMLANMLAYYGNDFTSAFFASGDFTSYLPWKDKIVALPCWSKDAYASSATTGYAVVTTTKDLNGTVLFLVWGHWGRDTYYASKWFLEDGVFEFQSFPQHATSVILEISYGTDPTHPTVTVPEVLGTISETKVGPKGGIHPDP